MLHQGTGIFWGWALTVVPGDRIVTFVFTRSALRFSP